MGPSDSGVGVANQPRRWTENIDVGGLKLPVPSWTIPALGVIVILYIASTLLSQPIQAVYTRYQLGKTEEQDQQEAFKHFNEKPVTQIQQQGGGGTLQARMFSDGCVSVSFESDLTHETPHPHFVRKITSEASAPAPGRVSTALQLEREAKLKQVLAGFGGFDRSDDLPLEPVLQAHCLNAHPGPFDVTYGQHNGCWVQTWRHFQDGCVHYQWFNTCANVWDVNPDGSPRVYWTQCRH